MLKKTEDVRATVQEARRLWPVGTLLAHYKGGTYIVTGHGFDTERQEANIAYERRGGPGFAPIYEEGLTYHRPVSLFVEERFREIR